MSAIAWGNIRPTDAVRVVTDRSPYQQGRDEERAAIVDHIRATASTWEEPDIAFSIADEIEAGEHLKVAAADGT